MASSIINPKTKQNLQDIIVDLYLNVKIRSNKEIDALTPERLDSEKERLRKLDTFLLVEYIQSSIEILMNLNENNQANKLQKSHKKTFEIQNNEITEDNSELNLPPKFEAMLQKLEAEVRNHIRIEQQLKVHCEEQQFRIEENVRKQYDEHFQKLQNEIDKLSEYKKKWEEASEKIHKMTINENKLNAELKQLRENLQTINSSQNNSKDILSSNVKRFNLLRNSVATLGQNSGSTRNPALPAQQRILPPEARISPTTQKLLRILCN